MYISFRSFTSNHEIPDNYYFYLAVLNKHTSYILWILSSTVFLMKTTVWKRNAKCRAHKYIITILRFRRQILIYFSTTTTPAAERRRPARSSAPTNGHTTNLMHEINWFSHLVSEWRDKRLYNIILSVDQVFVIPNSFPIERLPWASAASLSSFPTQAYLIYTFGYDIYYKHAGRSFTLTFVYYLLCYIIQVPNVGNYVNINFANVFEGRQKYNVMCIKYKLYTTVF